MIDIKTQLLQYYQKYGENYFVSHVKKNKELMAGIEVLTSNSGLGSLKEKIGFIIHDQPSTTCEHLKSKKYLGVARGFGFCGKASKCLCLLNHISNKTKERSQNQSFDQKQEIRKKWTNTIQQRYGVTHPSKHDEIKQRKARTNFEKLGFNTPFESPIVQEKIKQTNFFKFGTKNPAENSTIKEKIKKTNLLRYGEEYFLSTEIARTKIIETNLKKYGKASVLSSPDIRKKIKNTIMEKYGVSNVSQRHYDVDILDILCNAEKFITVVSGRTFREIKEILPVDRTTLEKYAALYQCQDLICWDRSSFLEDKIKNFCESSNIVYEQNTRKIITPLELDFYFPLSNVAIECHGLYWHSELGGNKDSDYHYHKWKLCKEKGIDLYQYFEDEITQSFDVIASKILYLNNKHQGKIIGARKLQIDWLKNHQDEIEFYNKNHIQGIRSDRTYAIGAWIDAFDLVACMSLKVNKNNNQMEIVRFATDISNRYPGLFTKMLEWAVKQLQFQGTVTSWSDNRHSNGHLYKANGFALAREIKPGYFVTDYEIRWRREHFMKNKIKQRHPEVDLSKTEWQLEQELGYDRIWDAGKRLWMKCL